VRVLIAVVGLVYPLLIYAVSCSSGRARWRRWRPSFCSRTPRPVGGAGAATISRARRCPCCSWPSCWPWAAVIDDGRIFLFVPALVNGAMLIAFARTLVRGPSIVETFARLRHPELLPGRAPYLRRGDRGVVRVLRREHRVSLVLAVHGSLATWTLYNGLIAYLIVGLLLGAERVYRYWRFRGSYGDLLDRVLRRVLPRARPEADAERRARPNPRACAERARLRAASEDPRRSRVPGGTLSRVFPLCRASRRSAGCSTPRGTSSALPRRCAESKR